MPSDGKSIYSYHIQGGFPKISFFVVDHIWLPVFINTLRESYESVYTWL